MLMMLHRLIQEIDITNALVGRKAVTSRRRIVMRSEALALVAGAKKVERESGAPRCPIDAAKRKV